MEKSIESIDQKAAIWCKIGYIVGYRADIGDIAASLTGYAQFEAEARHLFQQGYAGPTSRRFACSHKTRGPAADYYDLRWHFMSDICLDIWT